MPEATDADMSLFNDTSMLLPSATRRAFNAPDVTNATPLPARNFSDDGEIDRLRRDIDHYRTTEDNLGPGFILMERLDKLQNQEIMLLKRRLEQFKDRDLQHDEDMEVRAVFNTVHSLYLR